ncbi:MAG: hypothetical protein ACKOBM_13495 [Gammaproteobacteria bacterium]
MTERLLACLFALLLSVSPPIQADPAPIPVPVLKNGPCPPGYYTSGNYCTPSERANPLVQKNGPCPPGYYTSGNYCVGQERAKLTVPKVGPCPPGYYTSGKYCQKG